MSWQPADDGLCEGSEACPSVEEVIRPKEHDIGAFSVRRLLPSDRRKLVGPFIFFDHFGPVTLGPDENIDVRPHPHIGLATLSWLWEGTILHRDSLGYEQEIQPGEVNWMTAGRGIVHSERTPDRLRGAEKRISGLQIWMALPQEYEEAEPSFQHYGADELPVIQRDRVTITIIAGCAFGETAPVSIYSETLYADIRMDAGGVVTLPADHAERAVYLLEGEVTIEGVEFAPGEMLVLRPGLEACVTAPGGAHFVWLGGAPIAGDRIRFWNFVSSSRDRINRAKEDWREGRFPRVPGDEDEFIPLPEK